MAASEARRPTPSLTPVPGGQSNAPGPVGTLIPTTQTDWGEILDDLPASFPLYPDAGPAEVPDEVVSGSFEAPADVDALVDLVHRHLHGARLRDRHRHPARGRQPGDGRGRGPAGVPDPDHLPAGGRIDDHDRARRVGVRDRHRLTSSRRGSACKPKRSDVLGAGLLAVVLVVLVVLIVLAALPS